MSLNSNLILLIHQFQQMFNMNLKSLNSNLILLILLLIYDGRATYLSLNSNLILLIPETIAEEAEYLIFKFQSDSINTIK